MSDQFGLRSDPELDRKFGRSLRQWPPFVDSDPALRRLGRHFRLIVLSKVDRAGFASSVIRTAPPFRGRVHGRRHPQLQAELPEFPVSDRALRARSRDPGETMLLHVVRSLHQAYVPAVAAGLSIVRIDRQRGRSGAVHPVVDRPDIAFIIPDFAALAACHQAERDPA